MHSDGKTFSRYFETEYQICRSGKCYVDFVLLFEVKDCREDVDCGETIEYSNHVTLYER